MTAEAELNKFREQIQKLREAIPAQSTEGMERFNALSLAEVILTKSAGQLENPMGLKAIFEQAKGELKEKGANDHQFVPVENALNELISATQKSSNFKPKGP